MGEASDRLDTLRPDTIFLSAVAMAWLGVSVGDTLPVQVGLGETKLRVAGALRTPKSRYAVMDIAAVQDRFGWLGRLSRIELRLRPGTDVDAFRSRVSATLPPGLVIEKPEASVRATADLSRAYRVNLQVLALMALFTGSLLVFSSQALAVVRRRRQLALLRVLGATRRDLLRLMLAEGAAVGALGALLGLVAGHAIAAAIVHFLGADLGAGYFRGVQASVGIDVVSALFYLALGIAAALLGCFAPAREAAHAQPAAALKAGDEETAFVRFRAAWPGVLMLIAGALAALAPPIAELPLPGYFSIAALLIGTLLLMPRVAALLLRLLPEPPSASTGLALHQLRGAPGQAAVSVMAIVASVALMVSMAIMVASFRVSLAEWLERVLPADLYLRVGGASDNAYIAPNDQTRIAALPGVRRVEFQRFQQVLLDPERPRVTLLAREIDPRDPGKRLPLIGAFIVPSPNDPPPVWVSEAMSDLYGYALGQKVEIPLAGHSVTFTVAGIWRDYARQHGAVAIERARYVALTGDAHASDAAIWVDAGVQVSQIKTAIEAMIGGRGRMDVALPGEIRRISLATFDRTFAVTYALEAVAVLIGLVALSASFGALVLARRREFGVLRHLGMTRTQIAAMLASEGGLVGGVGLTVGLALGFIISLILIHVVNRQSFHWSMELHLPWTPLAVFTVVLLTLAALTAAASGRQAMRADVVSAVKEDW